MMRNDRLGLLQVTRLVITTVAVTAVASVDSLASGGTGGIPALVAWALVTSAAEGARRVARVRNLVQPLAALVLDGFVLAFVIASTGGYHSPLIGLVYLHVVAVGLLVSHRVALRISLWHGLLLFGGFAAAASHTFGLELGDRGRGRRLAPRSTPTGFLLVAIGVAACAALNEQAVRRTHRELSAIGTVGAALTGALDVDRVLLTAADALRSSLDAVRAAAVAVTEETGGRARGARRRPPSSCAAPPRSTTAPSQAELRALPGGALIDLLLGRDQRHRRTLRVGRRPWRGAPRDGRGPTGAGAGDHPDDGGAHRVADRHDARQRAPARVDRAAATRDGLTGLANRRVFDLALADDIRRARRTDEPFALVVLDVDHFKSVNDVHGHQAGDKVLRRVAGGLADDAGRATSPPATAARSSWCCCAAATSAMPSRSPTTCAAPRC